MEQLEGDYICGCSSFLFCLYRLNTFTTTNRQSRALQTLLWKGSRKSCHILDQWFRTFLQLRFFWEKWEVNCALLFSTSVAAFCLEPVPFHSPNPLWDISFCLLPRDCKILPFAATGALAAALPQRQSLCLSLTLQRCQVPGLWESHTWSAPPPNQALASPTKCCSPTRRNCKKERPLEDSCQNSPAESKG